MPILGHFRARIECCPKYIKFGPFSLVFKQFWATRAMSAAFLSWEIYFEIMKHLDDVSAIGQINRAAYQAYKYFRECYVIKSVEIFQKDSYLLVKFKNRSCPNKYFGYWSVGYAFGHYIENYAVKGGELQQIIDYKNPIKSGNFGLVTTDKQGNVNQNVHCVFFTEFLSITIDKFFYNSNTSSYAYSMNSSTKYEIVNSCIRCIFDNGTYADYDPHEYLGYYDTYIAGTELEKNIGKTFLKQLERVNNYILYRLSKST